MITIDIGLTSAEVRNPSELRREPFTTGTVGREVLLVFSGEWSGLAKTAVFIGSDDTRDVLITGTALSTVVVVPHEVLVKPCGELTLGVYGTNGDTIAIPTVYTSLGMIRQGADPSGDPSTDPGLPVWAQVQAEQQRQAAAIENRIKKFYTAGTEGNIPDSDDGTLRELKVYGNSVQDDTPTPDHPIAIGSVVNPVVESVGANLIDPSTCVNGLLDWETGDVTPSSGWITTDYIAVNAPVIGITGNKKADKPNICVRCHEYDTNKKSITDTRDINVVDVPSFTANVTLNSNTKYVRLTFGFLNESTPVDQYFAKNEIQIVNGTHQPYTPYKSTTAPIPGITLRKVGNVADYVDVERGVVVRNVAEIDMGDLTWFSHNASRTLAYKPDNMPLVPSDSIKANWLSTGFGVATYDIVVNHTIDNVIGQALAGYIGLYSSNISSLDDAKNITRGVSLVYPLATPTEEAIPADILAQLRAIKSYYPRTNVAVTSDEVDGAASFLYPVSVEKFVEYTKQQMGDTRAFIYDLQDIADNAYINAEYATVLAEFALDDY